VEVEELRVMFEVAAAAVMRSSGTPSSSMWPESEKGDRSGEPLTGAETFSCEGE
jgi:hypothetical protein